MTTLAKPARRSPAPAAVPEGTLAAIHDMLERLESVTDAGRQHLMSKIVAVLAAHPRAADPPVAASVENLRREARKAVPDGSTFVRLAGPLVVTLVAGS
jgi:hypothetical protein